MAKYLNQDLSFDEVRWATMRKTSYDSRASFTGAPQKQLLPLGTRLFRLVHIPTGKYFDGVWWFPKDLFDAIRQDANRSLRGNGPLFRNYLAQYLALPSGSCQLAVIEVELTQNVYSWTGPSSPLFRRPGGGRQVFLPNLADRGNARVSSHARVVATYWLKF